MDPFHNISSFKDKWLNHLVSEPLSVGLNPARYMILGEILNSLIYSQWTIFPRVCPHTKPLKICLHIRGCV